MNAFAGSADQGQLSAASAAEGTPARPTALVLGLGNELIADDGFGPAVAGACRSWASRREDVAIESAAVAGLRLLDLISGYRRVLIVDVIKTLKHPPGTLLRWPLSEASRTFTLGGSHQVDIDAALSMGRSAGHVLPDAITLLVAEARELLLLRERLSDELAAAVPRAARLAMEWLDETGAFAPQKGIGDDEARILS